MSKSDDRKLAALVRKNAAKVAATKQRAQKKYDSTLPPDTTAEDLERREFFSEMKKREF